MIFVGLAIADGVTDAPPWMQLGVLFVLANVASTLLGYAFEADEKATPPPNDPLETRAG
jgi:hypothetical protein